MLQFIQFVAVFSCAIFAGASVYINLVEHPARMGCGTLVAATQWAPSYKRATAMQATLALLSLVCGAWAWLLSDIFGWLLGALLIGLVVPFTFLVIMPVNGRLLSPGRDLSSQQTNQLLQKWGTLHAVRSVLSTFALVVFLVLLIRA
jgi:hypothetical protein